MKRAIHLVCNAHLDPVWLWSWEEGASEAISTFRTAADLCEEFDEFVFNHNEAILYEWVRQYEPRLFARIQRLVRQGRWHIMGGWYLQPDCNMPSGESLIRQITAGRRYFDEHFGVRPTTAINFDPFGHSRGLVQIMSQAGYDSYVICRPTRQEMPLDHTEFEWIGFDGSAITVCRPHLWYNSPLGEAADKVRTQMKDKPDEPCALVLWGVGNHGGGPSRKDLRDLRALMARTQDFQIRHSTPEQFFAQHRRCHPHRALPRIERDLNPWGVGCYTSQCRVKQRHRTLESELFLTEKMASVAMASGLLDYPHDELAEAQRDLMFSQFHDILPGSAIEQVEETSLRLMDHGLEILSRLKMQAFVALSASQPKARLDRIPLLVYNPHPYSVRTTVVCEFQPAAQNLSGSWLKPRVYQGRRELPSQVEKEASNIAIDWRKRIVFNAELLPSRMNRFDVQLQTLTKKDSLPSMPRQDAIHHRTRQLDIAISTRTGLMDRCLSDGRSILKKHAFCPLVMRDDEDPWAMHVRSFRHVVGRFELMSPTRAASFSGIRDKTLPPVRIIEDGPIRTVVEALFTYQHSAIVCHYELPKRGTQIGVEWRVFWQQPDALLKMSVPTVCGRFSRYLGQTAFGVHDLPTNGDECVAQQWVAASDDRADLAVTLINEGVHGSDYHAGEIRMSLLRSPAYSAHPIDDRPRVPQDRHTPRIDQGERIFRFYLNAGRQRQRLYAVDREAAVIHEAPMAMSYFPAGGKRLPASGPSISGPAILCSAIYRDGKSWIVRLFNPTDRRRRTILQWHGVIKPVTVVVDARRIVTLCISGQSRSVTVVTDLR